MIDRRGDGPSPARILLIGEYWGEEEERRREPFQGASGILLNSMLHEAGIMRSECYCTNVANFRPQEGEAASWIAVKKKDITKGHVLFRDKYVLPIIPQAYARLLSEIEEVDPNIIVTLGGMSMWLLTGAWGILKWRGSQLNLDGKKEGRKLIPTINPAAVLREFTLRPAVVLDLRRAAGERDTKEYTNIPEWKFIVRPSCTTVLTKLAELTALCGTEPTWLDFDLETKLGHIDCAGISWSRTEAICIPFMARSDPAGYFSEEEEAAIVFALYRLLTHPNAKVRGQNLLYDCQYCYRHWHWIPRVAQDTMLSHHSCFAGLRKSLDYQASMYCDYYVQWKPDKSTWKEGG